ncbi:MULTISPECIES: putative toxin-antitoxin system toxin component, PIN family [unclassified Thioalkalivibrio]|uniref:putative toxin-antitoxin system toxin component, PIN family n=1 Tax=unclassified Thioalkalivibrio TaxID=2621013 RepID=UPI00035EC5C5|nr:MULTISPECIES: putative toxin-antitoxin system toxin component, PIN family [unclassified Thioalkalivibrio]
MNNRTYIVDTNVVVAGLLSADAESPVCHILDDMLDARLPFLLSPDLLGEYRRVLLRPRLTRLHGLEAGTIDDLLVHLTANAIWREPPPSPCAAPDPGDAHLWALLHLQPHTVLITGDRLLLDDPPAEGKVITAGDYVSIG